MNLSNLPNNPLLIVAGYLIEDPKDFISFKRTCKKFNSVTNKITHFPVENKNVITLMPLITKEGESPKTISFNHHFEPLKELCRQKHTREKQLKTLKGSVDCEGSIAQASIKIATTKNDLNIAKNNIEKLTEGRYFQNWRFMEELAEQNPYFSHESFHTTAQKQGYTAAFHLYVDKEIVDAHDAYITAKDRLQQTERTLDRLSHSYTLLIGSKSKIGEIEDLTRQMHDLGRKLTHLFLKTIHA